MAVKIGRNDKCFCGSGKKHKKCCLYKSSKNSFNAGQSYNYLNKKSQRLKSCLYSGDCSNKVIKAHSVSKSWLTKIASNNEVYSVNLDSIKSSEERWEFKKIGLRNASTFTGFCNEHDNRIFQPIENINICNEIISPTSHQCFLLAYRSLTREIYKRKCFNYPDIKNLQEIYNKMINIMENKSYDTLNYICFNFDNVPPVMVSGTNYPTYDFSGKKVQYLETSSVSLRQWFINSFFDGNSHWIIFSWFKKDDEVIRPIIDTLFNLDEEHRSNYLLQYILYNFENIFISPEWWDGLSNTIKRQIKKNRKETFFDDCFNIELMPCFSYANNRDY